MQEINASENARPPTTPTSPAREELPGAPSGPSPVEGVETATQTASPASASPQPTTLAAADSATASLVAMSRWPDFTQGWRYAACFLLGGLLTLLLIASHLGSFLASLVSLYPAHAMLLCGMPVACFFLWQQWADGFVTVLGPLATSFKCSHRRAAMRGRGLCGQLQLEPYIDVCLKIATEKPHHLSWTCSVFFKKSRISCKLSPT